MSRKKALGKKIAHTLMAMSIVYSSGINIVVNQVYAGEKTENITGSSASFTETGANGNNYAMSGGVTDGEDASITGKITDSNVAANPIVITANGGHGGIDNGNSPTVMQGAIGGDAIAKVTVDESLSSITTGNITVNATGGSNGSAYQGVARSGFGVAASAAFPAFSSTKPCSIFASIFTRSSGSGLLALAWFHWKRASTRRPTCQ